jgi:putative FmdB family regulatory protein
VPIYEYQCRACGHQFERLLRPGAVDETGCPACGGADPERLQSGFAVTSDGLSQARIDRARQQIRTSKDTKDKQVAQAEYEHKHRNDHH